MHLLCSGQYASCVHAGGLSCIDSSSEPEIRQTALGPSKTEGGKETDNDRTSSTDCSVDSHDKLELNRECFVSFCRLSIRKLTRYLGKSTQSASGTEGQSKDITECTGMTLRTRFQSAWLRPLRTVSRPVSYANMDVDHSETDDSKPKNKSRPLNGPSREMM